MRTHIQAYTPLKRITDSLSLIYCILSNGKVIKYHIFISVVVIELFVRYLNTGPEDRLDDATDLGSIGPVVSEKKIFFSFSQYKTTLNMRPLRQFHFVPRGII